MFREPDDGVALEIAAVLGHEVDAVEWRIACEMVKVRPAPDLLEVMFEYRLARSPQGPGFAWSFVHGMLREALVIRAKESGRIVDHHLVCAKLLENDESDSNGSGVLGIYWLQPIESACPCFSKRRLST